MGQINNGDIITIAGVYADGTTAKYEGPYDQKPLRYMQAVGPEGDHDITMFKLVDITKAKAEYVLAKQRQES